MASLSKAEVLLSKFLLVALLALLAMKYGLRAKLRLWKPHLDRAVNISIVALIVVYAGQFVWWYVMRTPRGP